MSATPENKDTLLANRLDEFDDRLGATVDDVDLLAEIQAGIGDLLARTDHPEDEIRRILQQRYEDGGLRKETFQLVKSMLDRYVTEQLPTSPTGTDSDVREIPWAALASDLGANDSNDTFGSTTVIPVGEMPVIASDPDSRVQVGTLLRDRFLLQEQVSGGSMGVVYKALDRRLAEAGSSDHWVAIKVLAPQLAENGQALRALQQEAAKGRCLVHPNIVRFIDLDRDDELYFLVMEWLEGRTLADILDSADSAEIDLEAAFKIVRQIGNALDYAHRCGIVHADVKPGNIMITPQGDARLFDFGVARVRQEHLDAKFDPGIPGALTPAYSSMQVLTGDEPDVTDDVFSLACLFYRLVAGYRVFGPRNAAEASAEGMKPQRLQAISKTQWSAVRKALSYARVTRFRSVREFIDALDEKADEAISLVAPERTISKTSGGSSKWIVALLLTIGVLAAIAYRSGYLDPLLFALPKPVAGTGNLEAVVSDAGSGNSSVAEEIASAIETDPVADDAASEVAIDVNEETLGTAFELPLVDYSKLPAPTLVIPISKTAAATARAKITLREDGEEVIVEFVRSGSLGLPLELRLEEVGFSGNRSPWAAGQYTFSDEGNVFFPSGQSRARIALTMVSDRVREADQVSTLRLRNIEFAVSQFAVLSVTLEDDDQRTFEAKLPPNTIAFATGQILIQERDPAVQIDLVRYNPDNASVDVDFQLIDITATESSDYFAPGLRSVTFGPGQRSARILIPLVQDSEAEGDETFVIELVGVPSFTSDVVHLRIAVIIRDN